MMLVAAVWYALYQTVVLPFKYLDEGEKALKYIKSRKRAQRREKRAKEPKAAKEFL